MESGTERLVSPLMASAALVVSVLAVALAKAASVPFWDGVPLALCSGLLAGLAKFIWRPTGMRARAKLA
jgi:hypothetical protein